LVDRSTSFSNSDYVQKTKAGDKSAFDVLIHRYTGMVHAIALAHLKQDADQANELTQEVFLRAWLQLDKLSRPEYFPAWIAQITRNLAADWMRRDRRRSALIQMVSIDNPECDSIPSDGMTSEEAHVKNEENQLITNALKKLPKNQQEMLLLHYTEGLSASEIARRERVQTSTITRRIIQALRTLRSFYDQEPAATLQAQPDKREHLKRRTAAIIAAAWALSQSRRNSLAATAAASFLTRDLKGRPGGFRSIVNGRILVVLGALLSISIFLSYSHHSRNRRIEPNHDIIESHHPLGDAVIMPLTNSKVGRLNQKLIANLQKQHSHFDTVVNTVNHDGQTAYPYANDSEFQSAPPIPKIKDVAKVEASVGLVTGRLLTQDSLPVANMKIHCMLARPDSHLSQKEVQTIGLLDGTKLPLSSILNRVDGLPHTSSFPVHLISDKHKIISTDRNGFFSLDSDTTGIAVLSIDQPPEIRLLQAVKMPSRDLQIKLSTNSATASGTVRNLSTGLPVAGAAVSIRPYLLVEFPLGDIWGTQTIRMGAIRPILVGTDNQGHYTVDHLPGCSMEIYARKGDNINVPMWLSVRNNETITPESGGPTKIPMRLPFRDFILQEGETRVLPDIMLYPSYTIRGTVLDKVTHLPLSNVEISQITDNRSPDGTPQTAITDENGQYGMKVFPSQREETLETGVFDQAGRVGIPSIMPPLVAQKKGYKATKSFPKDVSHFDPKHLELRLDFQLVRDNRLN